MKTKVFKVVVLATFAIIAGLNVYKSQTENQLAESLLKNVEALADFDPITSDHTCVYDGQYCILYLNGEVIFQSFRYRGEN